MRLNDKTGLSNLFLAILAPQALALQNASQCLNDRSLANLANASIPSTPALFVDIKPSSTFTGAKSIVKPMPILTELPMPNQFKAVIKDFKNNALEKLTQKSINTQSELNQKASEVFKQYAGIVKCPNIPQNKMVDITPYIDLIKKEFPDVAQKINLDTAVDYMLKQNCPEYSGKDKKSGKQTVSAFEAIVCATSLLFTCGCVVLVAGKMTGGI